MHFNALACALVGGLALEVAANPAPAAAPYGNAARRAHAVENMPYTNDDVKHRLRNAEPAAVHTDIHDVREIPGDTGGVSPPTKRSVPDTHILHERQPESWSSRWARIKRAPASGLLPMRIGLIQRNLDAGHDRLMAISDPSSPEYGRHMSAAEVVELFAPERDTVTTVVAWLTSSGIAVDRISQSANKQWIQFDASVAEAEALLFTEYHIFEHGATGTRDVAAEHYHIPRHVQPHIDYVTPGIRLRQDAGEAQKVRRRQEIELSRRSFRAMHTDPRPLVWGGGKSGSRVTAQAATVNVTTCSEYVTPDCIRYQYDIPRGQTAVKGNELGIFEALAQHYSKEDLDAYFAKIEPTIPQGTYPEARLVDGAIADVGVADAGGEAELDFQAAIPLIYPQKTVLFQVDDEVVQQNYISDHPKYMGFWNTFFDAIDGSYCSSSAYGEKGNCVKPECLDPEYPNKVAGGYNGTLQCGVYKPTNVISISYGGGEADLPAYYWRRQCSEIMKLGLQGTTVVISSGDSGVASAPGDGGANGCLGSGGAIFNPASEATCPYVLAVGATEFDLAPAPAPTGNGSKTNAAAPPQLKERAVTRFGSGGGFSNYFAQPLYQAWAVASYFEKVRLGFAGYVFVPGGDKPGEAEGGVFHLGGRAYPDVAAVGDNYVTRLKGQWVLIGGTSLSAPVWASVLTLVNEARLALGKRPVGFVNPVLYAHPEVFNDVTDGSNPGCGTNGFPAAKGWDPVTGLGTPNFPKLLQLYKDLP